MKLAGLIVGILLMLLSFVALVICLLLPSMTNNRVSFEEALIGIVPSVLVGIIAFFITAVSAILWFKSRKSAAGGNA